MAFVKLSDISTLSRGVRVVKKALMDVGEIPVYQNSLVPLGYYSKSNRCANMAFVISAGAAGKIGYSFVDFWAADDCLTITPNDLLNSRYLYHCLMNIQDYILSKVRTASIPRLSRDVIEQVVIPLPSFDEQNRIVSILDRFDALCNNLENGLPAEIEARQKQYEYYRDKLLSFKVLDVVE